MLIIISRSTSSCRRNLQISRFRFEAVGARLDIFFRVRKVGNAKAERSATSQSDQPMTWHNARDHRALASKLCPQLLQLSSELSKLTLDLPPTLLILDNK
jgi:hypothetical protein